MKASGKIMLSKNTLESIVSFTEFWGVLITLVGALLLFVTVVSNRPLKRLLAAEAQKEREEAEHQRLALQGQIAAAQETAALANERAEQERLARIRIEQRLASRRINEMEYQAFVLALQPYAASSVQVQTMGDFEAGQFADDIIKMLSAARWKVQVHFAGIIRPRLMDFSVR